jgi:hypothetical protein
MRSRLKYGVPIAAGLATGGYALSQGEDPGSAALAGLGGAAGGAAGLLGARMAGKYMAPDTAVYTGKFIGEVLPPLYRELQKGREGGLLQKMALAIEKRPGEEALSQLGQVFSGRTQGTPFERNIQKGIAAASVPASAALAGLGGVALGAIPGSMGIPGFQQNVIYDPEATGSMNSTGARYKQPTMQYV